MSKVFICAAIPDELATREEPGIYSKPDGPCRCANGISGIREMDV